MIVPITQTYTYIIFIFSYLSREKCKKIFPPIAWSLKSVAQTVAQMLKRDQAKSPNPLILKVPGGGIEPPTRGFSVPSIGFL